MTGLLNLSNSFIAVTNLALGKEVVGSSVWLNHQYDNLWRKAVDGQTHVTEVNQFFVTNYELHPWLTVKLGRLSIVKSVTLYNRNDDHGKSAI
jgi:hypothetical protein